MDIQQLLQIGAERAGPLDEAAYLQAWLQHAAIATSPLSMALAGGACADRLAWVFVAGYQAALRSVFPALGAEGWACFAVTEDRSGEFSGVDWQSHDDQVVVTGHKSWIAASQHVQQLVVKAGKGDRACYVLLRRDDPGVVLSSREAPGFLPDLSQGFAALDCQVDATRVLDDGRVEQFRWREPLYIYTAFLAWLAASRTVQADQVQEGLQLAAQLSEGSQREASLWQPFNELVQTLLGGITNDDPAWLRDQRLIKMYAG